MLNKMFESNKEWWELFASSFNPKELSSSEFDTICSLEQDMWARNEWLWEYVKCSDCSKIHSKQDIFWCISDKIYTKTVSTIEQILALDSIQCTDCWSDTKHMYWDEEHKSKILDRYNNSESYMSLLRTDNWDIKWFMDWYIDSFNTIYERELKYHYELVWKDFLIKFIEEALWWKLPSKLLSYSALWTEEKYMNLYNIFKLLSTFFYSIPNFNNNVVWITELNAWKTLHALYSWLWILRLNLSTKKELEWFKVDLKDDYNSDIFLQKTIVENWDYFNIPVSKFIRKNIKSIRSVLVD